MEAGTHNIPPIFTNKIILFNGDQLCGWELLRYLWGLCSMSCLICMVFVADLIACRLDFSCVLWNHVEQQELRCCGMGCCKRAAVCVFLVRLL